MKVEDMMENEFVTVQVDDRLEDIVKIFAKNGITSALVFDKDEFIGIVSETEIVKYFTPKKFLFLWKKEKPTPVAELKKVTAMMIVKKPVMTLNGEQDMSNVLEKVARMVDCIPVMEGKKVVGVIDGGNITKFFLKEFAKGEYKETATSDVEHAGSKIDTVMDDILELLRKEGEVSTHRIAKELDISLKTVEDLCGCLQRHQLVEIKYTFLRGAIVRRKEYGEG